MSVYKHNYRAYTGALTPRWKRVLVLTRYGLDEVWASKIAIGFCIFSMLPIVIAMVQIYFANNETARQLILKSNTRIFDIDATFFLRMLVTQNYLALALASWIAPRLITYDLADNALPILLSHPISRFGYVTGKFLALFASLSLVTWVPCIALFLYQAYSAPAGWTGSNLTIAWGLIAGSFIWIALLSLLGLALSSWVKWKIVATGFIFAAILVPAGVGGIVTAVMRTKWGLLLNLPGMMLQLWPRLLGAPETFRRGPDWALPSGAIVTMLILAGLAGVAMLNARIRAREVVRG